jgi:hypothetical protein
MLVFDASRRRTSVVHHSRPQTKLQHTEGSIGRLVRMVRGRSGRRISTRRIFCGSRNGGLPYTSRFFLGSPWVLHCSALRERTSIASFDGLRMTNPDPFATTQSRPSSRSHLPAPPSRMVFSKRSPSSEAASEECAGEVVFGPRAGCVTKLAMVRSLKTV